jgi:signal transduction histidine kinase
VRTSSFLGSTSFRLIAWYAAVFGVSVAVLISVVYLITGAALEQQFRDSVDRETRVLVDVYRNRGLENTVRGINRRLSELKSPRMYFLLQETTGERIVGNLPPMAPAGGWTMMEVPASSQTAADDEDDAPGGRSMIALGSRHADGRFLLIGENRYRETKAKEAILVAMGWCIAVTVFLALVGGMLINAGFMRRIEDINRTSRAIIAGSLSNRVPARGSGDEMDQLAVNLNAMLDRIQSLMESLKRVSDDIAHDLRTPLSRLRLRLEAARERAGTDGDGTAVIEESIAEVDAILETFAALLRIAQIESGTRRSAFAEVDLGQVASAVAETYTAVAEDRGQRVRAEVEGSALVQGDRELLTQMIANLVENSIRYSPAGTDVVVSLAKERGEPVLGIADTGPGVPAHEREKVLQRFYRLEASRTTPGSGLGLALVKAVADLHGATLELLENNPGLRVVVRFHSQANAKIRHGLAHPVPAQFSAAL